MSDKNKEYIPCINRSWSTNHLVNPKTKTTICGLRWTANPQNDKLCVWTPNALLFSADKNCKRCFKKED